MQQLLCRTSSGCDLQEAYAFHSIAQLEAARQTQKHKLNFARRENHTASNKGYSTRDEYARLYSAHLKPQPSTNMQNEIGKCKVRSRRIHQLIDWELRIGK